MKKFSGGLGSLLLAASLPAATYFVSPTGNDANPGTEASPFYNVSKAVPLATAGDTIFMRGGTYVYNNTIRITNSGAPGAHIKLWAYTNELPFLDFSGMADHADNRAFLLTTNANWWHIKGLEIYRAGDNGMKIESSHNIIEQCSFHHCRDSGLQIGFGDSDPDFPDRACSNLVLNCDSYLNYDPRASGGNADGFACKLHPGQGNVFRGCRAWENSDDGWDLYKALYPIVLEDCWTWHNGDPASFGVSKAGNAGGFKLGGDSNYAGPHRVIRCIAFNNTGFGQSSAGKAFHQNDNQAGLILHNCLSFSNNYNYALNNDIPGQHEMKNCVGFAGITKNAATNGNTLQVSNSWNFAGAVLVANAGDYGDLSETAAKAPRGADGSLPAGFARLVSGSDLIDKGVNLGVPFNGSAPDLGPFEFAVLQQLVSIGAAYWTNGTFNLRVDGLTSHGPVVIHTSSNLSNWNPVHTNPPVTGSLQYSDPSSAGGLQRFYRAEEK
ncbi:MAG TPA: right-handed parallel beta-helix repeat-containing protein [Verrucomicrobiota bacterium]|nr:right-handed parallel beta-helix repeat-containing protein [Verrucomicrobiota bacterium]